MLNKHFVKILLTFTIMIALGLLATLITNGYSEKGSIFLDDVAEVAE